MNSRNHLLVVDDDPEIRDLLSRYLRENGYDVSAAKNSREMEKILEVSKIDLIILDVMLPGRDGFEVARDLRTSSVLPIIMLTARGDDTDRIVGLEIGADDYIAKPFNPRELLARVKTVLRRTHVLHPRIGIYGKIAVFGGWTLNFVLRELTSSDGVGVKLTSGEFDLLAALVEHPQQIMSRELLLDITRGRHATPFDRSVDVQIGRLRRRMESDPRSPKLIKTIRGEGYILAEEVKFR